MVRVGGYSQPGHWPPSPNSETQDAIEAWAWASLARTLAGDMTAASCNHPPRWRTQRDATAGAACEGGGAQRGTGCAVAEAPVPWQPVYLESLAPTLCKRTGGGS